MKDVLIHQELIDALFCEKKSITIEVQDWRRLQMQTVSTIRMHLADEVVIYVLGEICSTVLWSKLEKLYVAKSLINILFFWR